MSNIALSNKQTVNLKQSYAKSTNTYAKGLTQPIPTKTKTDDFVENHSYKLVHAAIIFGVVYMFLKNYQETEPPMSSLIISE